MDAPSTIPIDDASQHIESDEVAYVLLEDCNIYIVGDADKISKLPEATWITVVHFSDSNNSGFEKDSVSPNDPCQRGELVLKPIQQAFTPTTTTTTTTTTESSSSSSSSIENRRIILEIANYNLAFDGTIADMCHSRYCCTAHGNRSDAALMVGLVQTCQCSKHIQIESMQLLLRRVVGDNQNNIQMKQNPHVAALLITFSIPSLDTAELEQHNKPKRNSKPLPPSVQLLYSLLRSDWDCLDHEIMTRLRQPIPLDNSSRYHLRNNGTLIQGRISLFPTKKLSLEELYIRIRGTSNQIWKPHQTSNNTDCWMNSLPEDVLVNHLSPFLRAKSLDCLRLSCTYLHTILRAVVPGLKLRLFQHQITSLEYMRRREIIEFSEEHCLSTNDASSSVAYGGDIHRAITGGVSVGLQSRKDRHRRYRLDQQNGNTYQTSLQGRYHDIVLARKAARGGFLCDEPGLGKSITVLSLILQTFGLYSKTKNDETSSNSIEEFRDENIFLAYWKEETPPVYQKPELNRLIRKLEQSHSLSYCFFYPANSIQASFPDYVNIIKTPICFEEILKRVKLDFYTSDFTLFEADIRLCFENAIHCNPVNHDLHLAAIELLSSFETLLVLFKNDQVKSAKKSFSNATAKPNSSIAAILDNRAKIEHLDSLLTSKATLLVVPGHLLNHWEEQIMMHIDFSYCTNRDEPLIFRFSDNNAGTRSRISEMLTKCNKEQTNCPLIFIDKSGTKKLPHEQFLSMFTIVLTTTQRLTNEWKNGTFQDELKTEDDSSLCPFMIKDPTTRACSLLKIHWTRLIVDEGHAMGRGKQSSAILFASWISAQRRWVMTGTPTPQTVAQSSLSNMNALFHFLQHDFFGSRFNGDQVWRIAIVRSWNDGHIASFFRLRNLIAMFMIRHTKLDIAELPCPRFTKTFAHLSVQEVKAYNTLVCAVQSNLLLTSMKGKVKGLQDSLLHRSQTKFAKEALNNLRLACSGGTRVIPTLTKVAFDETMNLLISHDADPIEMTIIENYLHRAVVEEFTSCMSCGIQLNTMLVTICAHLICTECITTETGSCPVCEAPINVDDFQLLQPGMLYEWAWNLENIDSTTNTGVAPSDEGNMNASVQGDDRLSAAGHVPMRPGVLPAIRSHRPNDGHECSYDATATHGKCFLCLEEHAECVMVSENSQCARCHRKAEACPEEESKFFYVINKLQVLQFEHSGRLSIQSKTAEYLIGEKITQRKPRAPKVIVFSQFRPILNTFGHRLLRRFGAGCVAEYWGQFRSEELLKFSKSNDCFCMLLGKDGSEGLDLSFVTHIFFLEEVWDKSLECQAVARAWRMGACGHVEVETLIAKDSVESLIADLETRLAWQEKDRFHDDSGGNSNSSMLSGTEFQRTKQNFLLKNAKLIKPHVEYHSNNQTVKRKHVDPISPGAEHEKSNTISTRARVHFV